MGVSFSALVVLSAIYLERRSYYEEQGMLSSSVSHQLSMVRL